MANKKTTPASESAEGSGKKKTVCPISREQFMKAAPVIKVDIGSGDKSIGSFVAGPREFSTDSLGYNISGKFTMVIDGKAVEFQVGMNVTAIGSKELPK